MVHKAPLSVGLARAKYDTLADRHHQLLWAQRTTQTS